ncbi:MAG: hypothetical protein IJ839_06175 [Ruminobacter sp.]|nr:hypothetical protein [Ruminobacter sp.]
MIYCVDLDGTLIKNDMSVTSFFSTILKKPLMLCQCYKWHKEGGRARLKYFLGEGYSFNVEDLQFNTQLVDFLREVAANPENSVYLVSGSTQSIVNKIAGYFDFFKEGFGSSLEVNLTGRNKLELMKKYFGENSNICYIGNARVDFKVWRGTQSGMVVSSSKCFIKKARECTDITRVFPAEFARLPK